jgi:hypothetical protein
VNHDEFDSEPIAQRNESVAAYYHIEFGSFVDLGRLGPRAALA